jgi:hypothetical protein
MGDVVEAIRDVKGTPEHQSGTQQQPADQSDDVERANDLAGPITLNPR